MDLQQFIEIGKELNLEGDALKEFVRQGQVAAREEQAAAREERVASRQRAKEEEELKLAARQAEMQHEKEIQVMHLEAEKARSEMVNVSSHTLDRSSEARVSIKCRSFHHFANLKMVWMLTCSVTSAMQIMPDGIVMIILWV